MLNRDELVQELKIFDFYVSSKILNPSAIKHERRQRISDTLIWPWNYYFSNSQ